MKLLITEKPSQCRDIAAAMGYSKAGKFFKGPGIVCAPAVGHLLELAAPEAIMTPSWSDPATLLPVPRTVPMEPIGKTKDALMDIKSLAGEADGVIIATDPDREGEGIGREILDWLKWKGPVQRLWLVGGMDKTSIQRAMKALRRGEETVGMYRAQQARALSDWAYILVTMGTTAAGRHGVFGPDLGTGQGRESVVSVGRVQTPTLAMVVRRDLAIEKFRPTNHYQPWIDIQQGEHTARLEYAPNVPADRVGDRFEGVSWYEFAGKDGETRSKPLFVDEGLVDAFTGRVLDAGTANLEVERKSIRKGPPKPYSMTTLQQAMNSRFKMTAKQTLEAAQALYEAGVLSYPRTERDQWPMQLFEDDAPDILRALKDAKDAEIRGVAATLVVPSKAPGAYTTKPQEHYALMPTRKLPDLAALPDTQRNVWITVARRYLEAHLPDATGFKITVTGTVDVTGLVEERPATFRAGKEVITEPGWITAFNDAPERDESLVAIKGGASTILEANADAAQTTPPKRYTEATLIADMKAAAKFAGSKDDAEMLKAVTGIGTPATRDAIIEGLLVRGYIAREKSNILSTSKGRALIEHAHPTLKAVEMTAQWEGTLADIEGLPPGKAEAARDAFIEAQATFAEAIIRDCMARMAGSAPRPREFAAGAAGGKPTPKMIAFAEKLAERKGIKLPRGLKSDSAICRAFLDEHAGAGGSTGGGDSKPAATGGATPSDKQLAFMRKIAERKGVAIPPQAMADRRAASNWIDANA